MRTFAIVIAIAMLIAATPSSAWARPGGGGGARGGGGGARGGGGGARGGGGGGGRQMPASRPAPNQGRGFNLSNDVPSTRPASGGNRQGNNTGNRQGNNTGNGNRQGNNTGNGNRQGNNNGNRQGNNTGNGNNSGNKNNGNTNKNNGNTNVNNSRNTNVSGNTVNVNKNYNGYNGYGYHGAVVVNPVYRGGAWGWNHGVVWAPNYGYWGGGFWGAFAVGAASAALMGSIVNSNQTYTSYQVSSSSPGATLLSNYGLQQTQCGPSGLVVIYGPNNGVICANPNDRVAAGNYAVNENNLTIQSQQ